MSPDPIVHWYNRDTGDWVVGFPIVAVGHGLLLDWASLVPGKVVAVPNEGMLCSQSAKR